MALAADPLPTPVIIAPTPQPTPVTDLAGYVDAHFALERGRYEGFFNGDPDGEGTWRRNAIGGAGRGAWSVSPTFTLQLDAWFNLWQERFEERGSDNSGEGGVGTHFVFGDASGFRFGALTSVGREEAGTWANVAGELATSFGSLRVSAQGGVAFAVAGDAQVFGERAVYVVANATFYPAENLAITGHAGWHRWYEANDDGDATRQWTLGVRAEFQLGSSPLSIYGGYFFDREYYDDGGDGYTQIERIHTFYAGVRMLLGRDTLRALDDAVPFADYNPIYGDPFAHR
ncbi:MAG: hypothetical protein AB7O56_06770 [Bauldia sp.]